MSLATAGMALPVFDGVNTRATIYWGPFQTNIFVLTMAARITRLVEGGSGGQLAGMYATDASGGVDRSRPVWRLTIGRGGETLAFTVWSGGSAYTAVLYGFNECIGTLARIAALYGAGTGIILSARCGDTAIDGNNINARGFMISEQNTVLELGPGGAVFIPVFVALHGGPTATVHDAFRMMDTTVGQGTFHDMLAYVGRIAMFSADFTGFRLLGQGTVKSVVMEARMGDRVIEVPVNAALTLAWNRPAERLIYLSGTGTTTGGAGGGGGTGGSPGLIRS